MVTDSWQLGLQVPVEAFWLGLEIPQQPPVLGDVKSVICQVQGSNEVRKSSVQEAVDSDIVLR